MAAEKYAACCEQFRRFHISNLRKSEAVLKKKGKVNEFRNRLDLNLARILYVVIHSFFKYLVFNMQGGTVFVKDDYDWFFKFALNHFYKRFSKEKTHFGILSKILASKLKAIEGEKLEFKLQ